MYRRPADAGGSPGAKFYEYKRASQEEGLDGLEDQLPIPKSFPNETPAEVREKVTTISIEHLAWEPVKVSDNLRLEGVSVSPYPGYLLSQDTFMVGALKGVGRVYLQAAIDTYLLIARTIFCPLPNAT